MEFPHLSIFVLLSLALVATHAVLPPEVFWKSKLPNTPMPKAIPDLLHPTVARVANIPDIGSAKGTYTTQEHIDPDCTPIACVCYSPPCCCKLTNAKTP